MIVLLPGGSLLGQSKLQELARQLAGQYRTERAAAESLAHAAGLPIRRDLPGGGAIELQRFANGIPQYYITQNLNAAKTLSTDKVWAGAAYGFSLDGSGITLGEWDAGAVRTTHQEFGGRVLTTEGSLVAHSTHVAGTLIAVGVVAAAHGMAYQANLYSKDWNNDASEMAAAAATGLEISNHSYALITGWYYDYMNDGRWAWFGDTTVSNVTDYRFGFYDDNSQEWDNVAHNAPYYLICKAAGNDRLEGPTGTVQHWVYIQGSWVLRTVARNRDGAPSGFNSIEGYALAKNVLTVGAVNGIPGGYTKPSDVSLASFSGNGPADDGRIKPDIVADGVSLYSTLETANNAYGTMSGTSMATPNACGSASLLLQQQAKLHGSVLLRASTLKGLVIHTADEAGSFAGPDYTFGWGLMNTLSAARLMSLDSADGPQSHIAEYLLLQGDTLRIKVSSEGTEPLKATIAWSDPAGVIQAKSLNPPLRELVNDLDLRIVRRRDDTSYFPWTLNPSTPTAAAATGDNIRDNVEQVAISAPEKGVYTLRITHKGTLSGGSQYVSLIVSGNVPHLGPYVSASPLSFTHTMVPGDSTLDSLLILNEGDTAAAYRITPPSNGWLTVSPDSGSVPQGGSSRIHLAVNTRGLDPWKLFHQSLAITSDDSVHSPLTATVDVHTLGPTIGTSRDHITAAVDTGGIALDTFWIRNTGFTGLRFILSTSDSSPARGRTKKLTISSPGPSWLKLSRDTGTVAQGESLEVILTMNSTGLPENTYGSTILLASNDSATGTLHLPVMFVVGAQTILSFQVTRLWNLLSLPLLPPNHLKSVLLPGSITDAFAYEGGYVKKDTLDFGTGYWVKFDADRTIDIGGNRMVRDSIPVQEGWNLIGSLSEGLRVGSLASAPPGIIATPFWGYRGGYRAADSLEPGKGYWVSVRQRGALILELAGKAVPVQVILPPPPEWNTMTFTDNEGAFQTLYFGEAAGPSLERSGDFQLPPVPPEGIFDVRFRSNQSAAVTAAGGNREFRQAIRLQSGAFPVRVRWRILPADNRQYHLIDALGRRHALAGESGIRIGEGASGHVELVLEAVPSRLPQAYRLDQNHPNPFNPTTTIHYGLPFSSKVRLSVYTILGTEVATLVDGIEPAGERWVEFRGETLPSGVYFYRIVAQAVGGEGSAAFTAIRKMIILR